MSDLGFKTVLYDESTKVIYENKLQIRKLEQQVEELEANWAETIRSKEPLVKEILRLRKVNKELKELYETHKKVV